MHNFNQGGYKYEKKERKYGKKLGKALGCYFKHMGKEVKKEQRSNGVLRRCVSEGDLSKITKQTTEVQEQIQKLVNAFFERRYRLRHGRGFGNEDKHMRRWNNHRGNRRPNAQELNSQGESESNAEVRETGERGRKNRRYHENDNVCHGRRHFKHKHEMFQGRCSQEDNSSSEDDEYQFRKWKKHHHGRHHDYEHKHGNKRCRHYFKKWKKHGYCGFLVDASTMTEDMEESNQEVSESHETTEDIREAPASPEVQEVADNLRKSSLE